MTVWAVKILALLIALPLLALLVVSMLAWYGTVFVFAVVMWAAYLPIQLLAIVIEFICNIAIDLINKVK